MSNQASSSTPIPSTSSYPTSSAKFLATSIDHPRLTKTDSTSIRSFLRAYDQYVTEIAERSKQLTAASTITTEAISPVNLKFCVDAEWIDSLIALGFIESISTVEELTDALLRDYLNGEAQESKEVMNLHSLDDIVKKELRTDMSDSNAKSRMRNLFVSYRAILKRHGVAWLLEDNQKVAVDHVLSAIRPTSVKERLESDLEFAKYELKKNFQGFMKHAIRVAEAFQIVDNGKPRSNRQPEPSTTNRSGSKTPSDKNSTPTDDSKSKNGGGGKSKKAPLCLHPPCRSKGVRHFMRDCDQTTDDQKKALLKSLADEKAKTGPSKSTRSQTQAEDGNISGTKTVRRINQKLNFDSTTPSFTVTIQDGREMMEATARADDGSDESIVSAKLAEKAVLNGIGKISKIDPIKIQVALKANDDAKSFRFTRTWTTPRLVLRLNAGPLALNNATFLVPDGELAAEDLLIGLPILQHLGIDTKAMLEKHRDVLDGADCSTIRSPSLSTNGKVGRLMIARLNRIEGDITLNEQDTTRPHVNYYSVREEEDPFPDSSLLDPIDSSQESEINDSLIRMMDTASKNGLSEIETEELSKIVNEHKNIFRVSFSSGPPANVEPLRIELVNDAKPVRVRLRNYTQEQREFLADLTKRLIDSNMVFSNPTSPWACAPLLVPKPGPAKFRFTVDLRPVNRYTVKHQFPMPIIEHELTKVAGSTCYATFDLSHGYWQLPLHESSRSCQSFITPDGIFSPTRVMHGTSNAVMHIMSTFTNIIPDKLKNVFMVWVDDILLHCKTTRELLRAIRNLFQLCAHYNIKLHPDKCVLFCNETRWCGRIVSKDGIRFDPRRLEGIQNMEEPATGSQLQQFVCAMQWMRNAIPNFSNLVRPLMELLEIVYERAGKRTKISSAKIKLSEIGWSQEHRLVFEQCKAALANQVTLAHRDVSKRLCVYTDACDTVWSGVITQVPYEDLTNRHDDQRHEPLAFLSGHFSGSQLRWSIIEKEAYAVMATSDRMHWLLATPDGFDLYTDHHNLIFLFDPLAVVPDLSISSLRKVLRWAVRLSMYNYTCVHIKGIDNVWADIIGRWTHPITIRRLVEIPELPSSSSSDFDWPSRSEVHAVQMTYETIRPKNLALEDNLWKYPDGATWIPNDSIDMQLRLCIIAHTGPSGHRGVQPTESILRKSFFWDTISSDVRTFVHSCIHCLSTTGGGKIPRPFGPALHGTKPNDLLQFDYIEIAHGRSGEKYVLMLRDDHSNYAWFYATCDTAAEQAASAIIDWCAAFGTPKQLMSDGPTHFKNETIRQLAKGLRVPHHFTLPYSPWSNGGIERLGKELLRTFRAVVSELQMRVDEWADLLPVIQSALNNAPSPQRNNVSPITAFNGMEPSAPVNTFLRIETAKTMTIDEIVRERAIHVDELTKRMSDLHPVVHDALQENRARIRNATSKGTLPNFSEGDFVLVAREDFTAGEKLSLRWRGPRRVVKALSNYVFEVEDLRNGQCESIHGSRLKFYRDSSLNTEAIMSHVLQSETGMEVQRLMELIDSNDGMQVRVRWKGLSPEDDTLEPLQRVFDDVPQLVSKLFSRKNMQPDLVDKARKILRL